MQDRASAEEADPGDDLCRNTSGVAVGSSVGRETDLRDVNR
jgi:hypothetical protein